MDANTIRLIVDKGLFSKEIYYLVYGRDRIILKKENGKAIMQIDMTSQDITVERMILGSSLMMKLFGNDRETIQFRIE